MDVLLISPDHNNKKNNYPWGVLAVGSYLTAVKNLRVKLLDKSSLSHQEFKKELNGLLPQVGVVGIGLFSTDIPYIKTLVDDIKKIRPKVKIILGGPHCILEPEQTCSYKNIDFVAYSNGEQTMSRLIDELAKDRPDYDNIPGLIFKKDGKLIRTPPPDPVEFYDINYTLLPESTRRTFRDYMQVLTGRGCSFRCRFCYNSVIKTCFFPRPVEDIIRELEKIVELYDSKVIYFRDDNFFQDKKRIFDFLRLYKEKKFAFRWRATCRANYMNKRYINENLLKELDSINCETLKMGYESGSQRMLNYLNKGISINVMEKAVREVAKCKSILGNYSFMVGLPGESVEEYIATLKFIKFILKCNPKSEIIGPQYFRIYPGGSLYDEIKEKFDYSAPASFEEWAFKMDNNNNLFFNNEIYPWLPHKGRDLALYGETIVFLYKHPIKHFLTLKRFPALPFYFFVKLRFKFNWYNYLYDIRLYVKLMKFYFKFQ